MVPAWQEYDVIAAMVEDLVRVLDYRSYTVFVGTYQNDAATIAEVERMRHRYKHLHRVEVPHDGPTCKADCLNWLVQAILHYEFEAGIEFAGVVHARQRGRAASRRAEVLQLPAAAQGHDPVAGRVARTRMVRTRRGHLYGRVRRVAREGPRRAREPGGRGAVGGRGYVLFAPRDPGADRRNAKPAVQHRKPHRGLRCRRAHPQARHAVDFSRACRCSSARAGAPASASVPSAKSPSRCRSACASSSPIPFAPRTGSARDGRSASACRAGSRRAGTGRWRTAIC